MNPNQSPCDLTKNPLISEPKRIYMNTSIVTVITGGAHGIGRCIAQQFKAMGSAVAIIDISPLPYAIDADDLFLQADIADRQSLETFARHIVSKYGHVDNIINNALPIMRGIDTCTYDEFEYALKVGVTAPFYLVKLLKDHLSAHASVVNISSSRDRMSQPQTESYTAAKGGITALTHSMAVSLAGRARVNSISPGWIDTQHTTYDGPDAIQQPAGRVGTPTDIANMAVYLCSEKAGFITGENICIDGGMTRLMIYHGEHGWTLKP